ncbi:MAG: hypothetical protein ABIL47_08530 [candidate division WOR-3 bacterium]
MDENILKQSFLLGFIYGYKSGYEFGIRDFYAEGYDDFSCVLEGYDTFNQVKKDIESTEIKMIINLLEKEYKASETQ